ncbi:WW domain-binding protein 2-like [Acanthaster planci]|uniref:WW domain-binding protein 2-like n=1 Tax=Acanthaster planci TaxID=133434 RepID=A0A8B7XXR3_ACAPL|nr:WW domain-binding protein 2-like [Acanthaster planci]XP_022084831.1 WW domain-binding protein 2-like [Acanthaster planci]
MALNTAHSKNVRNGIVLYNGEQILQEQEKVELSFEITPKHDAFKGTKEGTVFLTNQRVIFINVKDDNAMKSFSMPFYYMKHVDIKQPLFGANAITGLIKSQEGGGWETHTQAEFKIVFKSGGAIELGQRLLRVATQAPRGRPPRPDQQPTPQPCAQYTAGYPAPIPGAQYPPPMVGGCAYPAQTVYPEYPPGAQPSEPPPPYSSVYTGAGSSAPPPPGPAYYNPNDPHNVYMTQTAPTTIPTAPPPEYSEKPKTD